MMAQGAKVLGVVPARAGSRRLPGKNTKPIAGKPLIAWTIEAGLSSTCIDRMMLSSDDDACIDVAHRLGCEVPFKRPRHLADDNASSLDVVLHLLDKTSAEDEGFEWLALLQPTSPLRTAADIDAAARLCLETGAESCVGVCGLPKPTSFFGSIVEGRLSMPSAVESTEAIPCLVNGAIYITRIDALRKHRSFTSGETVAYLMPYDRSIDIDEPYEFLMAEALLRARL